MFRYYKHLIRLRKNHPLLRQLNRKETEATAEESKQLLILHRWHNEQHLYCLMNFSREKQETSLPLNRPLQLLLNSADPEWKGGVSVAAVPTGTQTVPPESILVYSNEKA